MQIDLLSTGGGELGLVSNRTFDSQVSGIIFDVGEQSLTLEFGASMDSLKLNIPVGDDFVKTMKASRYMHVCAVEKGRMTYAAQAPVMTVSMNEDDFAYTELPRGVMPLQTWLKNSKFAQSVHRDNLGDTTSNGGIMHREGLSRATLQVAPQLAQQLVKEQQLAQRVQLQNAPRMVPPSLGPGSSMGPNPTLGRYAPRAPDNGENKE